MLLGLKVILSKDVSCKEGIKMTKFVCLTVYLELRQNCLLLKTW